MSTPSSAPFPVATMTAVGTAKPIAQGQAMISTDTAATRALMTGAVSAMTNHTINVAIANDSTTGTKTPLTRSARCWIGARDPWASRISCDNAAEHTVCTQCGGLIVKGAGAIHGSPDQAIARLFIDRQRFAGDHGFVNGGGS